MSDQAKYKRVAALWPKIAAELDGEDAGGEWMYLGWPSVESAGINDGAPTSLGEMGLYQIGVEEAADLGIDLERTATDIDYAIWAGVHLAHHYRNVLAGRGFSGDLLFYLMKFRHTVGSGTEDQILEDYAAANDGTLPTSIDDFRSFAETEGNVKGHDVPGWLSNADRVYSEGHAIAELANVNGSGGPVSAGTVIAGLLILALAVGVIVYSA